MVTKCAKICKNLSGKAKMLDIYKVKYIKVVGECEKMNCQSHLLRTKIHSFFNSSLKKGIHKIEYGAQMTSKTEDTLIL